jgi:hypothetical protein
VAAGGRRDGGPLAPPRVMTARTGTVSAALERPRVTGARAGDPRGIVRSALFGALGGLYGAGAMSVVRLAARRVGLIDKMVPQAVEEWLVNRIAGRSLRDPAGHHVLDQLLHLAYGSAWGAVFGPMLNRGPRRSLWLGAAAGTGLWALGMLAMIPSLRVARPVWQSSAGENAVNVTAHVIFGVAVQLLTEELTRQRDHRETSDAERHAARVG